MSLSNIISAVQGQDIPEIKLIFVSVEIESASLGSKYFQFVATDFDIY